MNFVYQTRTGVCSLAHSVIRPWRTLAAVFLAIFTVFLPPWGESIAEAFAIGANPLEVRHELTAGQSVAGAVEVYNGTDLPLHFTTSISDWFISSTGDLSFAPAGTLARSASSWIRVSPREFDIPPQQSFTVRYSVSIPTAPTSPVADGEYWALIRVRSQAVAATSGGLRIAGEVGIKVFVQLGAPVRSLAVSNMQLVNATAGASAGVQVEVRNTGNVHLRPQGKLEIHRGQELVWELPLNAEAATVLPDATRVFRAQFPSDLSSGEYVALAIFDYGGSRLAGGKLPFSVP